MENIKLGDLYLSKKESRNIIEFLAKMRNINDYKSKSSDRLHEIFKKKSKNKERIDNIRENFKKLNYKLSKSELIKIKTNFYNIEKRKKISKKTTKYLDELDNKIDKLEKYHGYDDFEYKGIKDINDLFKLSIDKDPYKPVLVKSGYNNNYVQYESKGDKILSIQEYLTLISDETRVMYTRSDNEEFMNGDDTNEIIKSLFKSFLQRFEENLQEKMRGSDFEFDGINFFYYNFNKTNIYRGGSYIAPPKWLKNKKSTINPKNNNHKFFQYAGTLALNFDNINNHPEKISKIRPFIDQYNWKDIDFPPTNKDWKKFELNNKVALNLPYIPHNTKKIQLAYRSKYNLTYNKQIILLMITDGEKWHYLVVNNL